MRTNRLYAMILCGLLTGSVVWSGCEETDPLDTIDGGSGKGQQGDPCAQQVDCDAQFVCAGAGTCEVPGSNGTRILDEGCSVDDDCLIQLVCSSINRCAEPGAGEEGSPCGGNESCGKGLVCSATATCAKPGDPGTKGAGESCEEMTECMLGLACVMDICQALAFWEGVTCDPDEKILRAYFEVPQGAVTEFYRLPFPNDVRLKNGRVDVSDHPDPGNAIPGEYGEVVANFYKAIGEDVAGFGLSPTTFFRMSKDFNLDTIDIRFVNIDQDSPNYGRKLGYQMGATNGRGKYICQNNITVRSAVGHPLSPLTTYAVYLPQGIKDTDGTDAQQDEDFTAMLAETEPTDAALKAAWQAYAPFRAYLVAEGIAAGDVLSAAVFTTMDPQARMSRFREVIHAEAQAAASADIMLCDGAAKSPCEDPDNEDHTCPDSPDSAFHELQGTFKVPVFQRGTPPYRTPADGGDIVYDAGGKPLIDRHEDACFALTVPPGAGMPVDGWPVVIFAHGTGGSYRSFIGNGTAAALANVTDSGGTVSKMAVISIDGSMHGPRRGTTDDPDGLFFNLANPYAARDNTYQGAADKYQLVRLIKAMNLEATSSPTGQAIKFDPERIYFFGHSQGTIEGIPFVIFEPDVKAVVLSGAGGYLLGSLLEKTKPVNVRGMVQLALADGDVGTNHPLLNLVQLYFEEIDGVNYGKSFFAAPPDGMAAKHTFLGYGVADSFTPPGTIGALASSMGIHQVTPIPGRCGDEICGLPESCKSCEEDCGACPEAATCGDDTCDKDKGESCVNCNEDCGMCKPYATMDPPVTANMGPAEAKVTAGMIQYVSDGTYDDHHVLFRNARAKTQSTHFLGSAARDEAPTIPAVN